MSKKKANVFDKRASSDADVASDLLDLAISMHIPEDALDAEIDDVAKEISLTIANNVKTGVTLTKIEFLLENGYRPERIKELIRENTP